MSEARLLNKERATRFSGSDVTTVIVVAVSFIALLPPAFLAPHVSILEVSVAVLAVSAAVAAGNPGVRWSAFALPVPLVLLLSVMTASILWSTAITNTIRDVFGFLCLVLAAWLLVARSRPAVLIGGIVVAGLLIASASLVVFVVDPVGATQWSSGSLEGIYANRNQLGFVMLQCFTAILAVRAASPAWLVGKVFVAVFFFAVLVASESRTSLVAAVVVAGVWLLVLALRRSRRYLWLGLGGMVVAGVVALANSSAILDLLGKDETLNGRAEIWSALIGAMQSNPGLGFGFLREWPGWSAQSQAVAAQMNGLQVVHAHNELLSWWSGTGLIGVVAILGLYLFVYWAGVKLLRSDEWIPSDAWPVLAMVALNVHGLTSTSETKPQGWFVLMMVVFVCVQAWREDSSLPRSMVVGTSTQLANTPRVNSSDGDVGDTSRGDQRVPQ